MGAYVVRRTLLAVLTIWVVSLFSWVLIQIPEGDYADSYMKIMTEWSVKTDWTPEEEEELRERFGLNRPIMVQYWDWMFAMIVHGEFGQSYTENRPIGDLIAETLPFTVALTAFTIALTWMLAIPIGIYSAMRQHSIGDYAFTLLGFTGLAVPDFLLHWCSCTSSLRISTRVSVACSQACTKLRPGASARSSICSST